MTADVVVIGGGMGGQTLVRQLLRREPRLRVAIVDASELPRPADTLRLGESTSEVAAWYLRDRLGLEEHLRERHIMKAGLRFFLADVGQRGFGGRSEFGLLRPQPGFWNTPFVGTNPPTFQLHRGRIEHFLVTENVALGATLVDRAAVRDVTLGAPHRITVGRGGSEEVLEAEWIVDATGPAGFLRPRIAEVVPGPHHARANFFWADAPLDCDEWSDHPEFVERVPRDVRWHSTGHLLGDGYWIWLIRLGSGQTSVGVVADPERHAPIDTPEKMLAWLDAHEPELAKASRRVGIKAVHTRETRSFRASRLIDPDRKVALTGDTAGFLDALYSPGMDFIAMANETITGAILDSADESDLARRSRMANVLHEHIHQHFTRLYDGIWNLTGNPRVMAAKVAWDMPIYWSFVALWMRSGQFGDPATFGLVSDPSWRIARLNDRVQDLLRAWARLDPGRDAVGHLDQASSRVLGEPLLELREIHRGPALRTVMLRNLDRLERLAIGLFQRAARSLDTPLPEGPWNPYGISLDPSRWDADGLVAGKARVQGIAAVTDDTRPLWLDPA